MSYNRGIIKVKIGNEYYNIEVLTGINSKNEEKFYDIVNIKKDTSRIRLKSEDNDVSSKYSISQSKQDVNYVNTDDKGSYTSLLILFMV